MKRCPTCDRSYFEIDLNFCLDDGERLVGGTDQDEPSTVILQGSIADSDIHATASKDEAKTRQLTETTEKTSALTGGLKQHTSPNGKSGRLLLAGGMILAFLAGGTGLWLFRPASVERPLLKLELHLSGSSQARHLGFNISPNGRMIAVVNDNKLWIRDLERAVSQEVANSEGADFPFWSPDSSQLGFFIEKKLFRVPNTGSGSTEFATIPAVMTGAGGASWGNDGTIVIATGERGLLRVPVQGGAPSQIVDPGTDEIDFHFASDLPGGRGILFTVHRSALAGSDTIEVFDGSVRRKVLQIPGAWISDPVYSSTGHILYTRTNSPPTGIWAIPFSLDKLEPSGEPFLVANGGEDPSVSDDGMLVYSARLTNVLSRLVLVDREGNVTKRIQTEDVPNQWPCVRLSPDGRQVVLSVSDRATGMDPVVVDVASGSSTRIASPIDTNGSWFCAWTADGKNVAYLNRTNSNHIALRSAAGTGDETLLFEGKDASFSFDGRYVIYTAAPTGYSSSDIWFRELKDGSAPVQYLASPSAEMAPEFSHDGKFVAYVSNETGREEVFVKTFPDDGRKWQISKQGGTVPRWSKRGDELFFNSANRIVLVAVTMSPKIEFGPPQPLFDYKPLNMERLSGSFESFDVSSDGKQFLMLQPAPNQSSGLTLKVIQNWYAEFKGK